MYRLDASQGILLRDGERVALVPKAVDLLRVLAEHAGRVVSKDELMAAVWPDVTVEEGNLSKLVFLLRRELGDGAIETVPRRGYRLAIAVATSEAPPSIHPRAWDLYLEGRVLWNRRPGDVVWQALECFQRAIELAPGFAPAWAGIADVYATLGSWEAGVLPHGDAQARAWSYASRALELDPGLVEAHTTCAYSILHYGWDLAGAEKRFRHALALDLAWHHFMAGAPEEALAQAERVVRMDPQFHWGHYFVAWGAETLGDAARSVEAMRRAVELSDDDTVMRAGLGRALASAGDHAAAAGIARELGGHGRYDYEVALIQLALGDRAAALSALGRACAVRSGWMIYAAVDPRLAVVRDELPEATAIAL